MRDVTRQVSTGERRRELEGHTARVCSLGVVGSRLASGSYDGSIRVWPTVRADRDSAHTLGARDGGLDATLTGQWPQRPCLWAAGARGATVERVKGREHPGTGGGEAGGGGEGGGVRR